MLMIVLGSVVYLLPWLQFIFINIILYHIIVHLLIFLKLQMYKFDGFYK